VGLPIIRAQFLANSDDPGAMPRRHCWRFANWHVFCLLTFSGPEGTWHDAGSTARPAYRQPMPQARPRA